MNNIFDIKEYFAVLLFFLIALFVSFLFSILPRFFSKSNPNREKLSEYECGFNPISSSRNVFDIRFYLVAILFIIFDLEIAFLFPWAISLSDIGLAGFWSMMIFLTILVVGFIYEWCKGALEWE